MVIGFHTLRGASGELSVFIKAVATARRERLSADKPLPEHRHPPRGGLGPHLQQLTFPSCLRLRALRWTTWAWATWAIPATWASKPAAKLKQTLAKHATAKRPGAPVDANALVMVRDSGDKLRGDAPMDLLENGETITFRRKAAAAAAS